MGADEIQAIERSGSCSLRLYIRADRPEAPVKLSQLSAAMRDRVGATVQGTGPIDTTQRRLRRNAYKIHLKAHGQVGPGHASCGYFSANGSVLAFRKFTRKRTDHRICDQCYRDWVAERSDPNGRHSG